MAQECRENRLAILYCITTRRMAQECRENRLALILGVPEEMYGPGVQGESEIPVPPTSEDIVWPRSAGRIDGICFTYLGLRSLLGSK